MSAFHLIAVACLSAALCLESTATAYAQDGCDVNYSLTDLGALESGYSASEDINDRGDIVGYSLTADFAAHAVLWAPGESLKDLTTGIAFGINDRRQVLVDRVGPTGESQALVWSPHGPTLHILDTLGGEGTSAFDINNPGQVVGWSDLENGDQHAFLWTPQDGPLQDLGTLGGPASSAAAINNRGQIAGHSTVSSGPEHAFLWSPRDLRMLDLGTIRDGWSYGEDINERAQVVGYVTGGVAHAFLWSQQTGMQDLGTLGGLNSSARSINNQGKVVGWSTLPAPPDYSDGPQHAFVWSKGCGMQDLNSLLSENVEVTLTSASAINNRGQIAADGEVGGFSHAFRLTPLPAED